MVTAINILKTVKKTPITLRDGTKVVIKKLKPKNSKQIKQFFSTLSSASKYDRFFIQKEELTDEEIHHCINPNPKEHFAIGAWKCDAAGNKEELIGTASYSPLQDTQHSAEFSILIADKWQRKGVGKTLVRTVIKCAKRAEVKRLLIYFLPNNTGMKKLAQSMSKDVSFKYEEGIVIADLRLDEGESVTVLWAKDVVGIWDDLFQSIINMCFMPYSLYYKTKKENKELFKELCHFDELSDFDEWLDLLEPKKA